MLRKKFRDLFLRFLYWLFADWWFVVLMGSLLALMVFHLSMYYSFFIV